MFDQGLVRVPAQNDGALSVFTPTREDARRFMFEAWSKYRSGAALSSIENIAVHIILMHPEYHVLLADASRNLERDFTPDDGALNPFLHLALHLAIEEQLSIDQPPGIRAQFERIKARMGAEHDAKHVLVECLAETIWQ